MAGESFCVACVQTLLSVAKESQYKFVLATDSKVCTQATFCEVAAIDEANGIRRLGFVKKAQR